MGDVDRALTMRSPAASAREVRARIRRGEHSGQTAGLAAGMVQGNVAILPADWAEDFLRFCLQNPKPCPILAVGRPGRPELPTLGGDIDIRSDLPRYRVFQDGVEVATPTNISEYWRDDLVAFVLGCSFSFEWALMEAGLRLRHVEAGSTVPMYRTNLDCAPSERFRGPMVVSMRPFRPAEAIRAIQITSRFPTVHGAPVHIGLPQAAAVHRAFPRLHAHHRHRQRDARHAVAASAAPPLLRRGRGRSYRRRSASAWRSPSWRASAISSRPASYPPACCPSTRISPSTWRNTASTCATSRRCAASPPSPPTRMPPRCTPAASTSSGKSSTSPWTRSATACR